MPIRRIVLADRESVALTRGATVIVRPTSRQPRKRLDAFPPVRSSGRGAPFEIWTPDADGDRISDLGRASVLWSGRPPAEPGDSVALLETYRHVELAADGQHGGYSFELEYRADMARSSRRLGGILYAHRGASSGRWLASRSMPSEYARHVRRLHSVECCRLHELTFTTIGAAMGVTSDLGPAAVEFQSRWDSRYMSRLLPWARNPLVWVLRLEPTIEQLLEPLGQSGDRCG